MQFLRENKYLFVMILVLPLFFSHIDKAAIGWLKEFHQNNSSTHALIQYADNLMDYISNGLTLIIFSLALYAFGRFFHNDGLHRVGRALFIGLVSAGISVQILKHLIGKARPRLTDHALFIGPSFKGGYDSFPSGHTTLAFCLAAILSDYIPGYRFILYLFAVVVGIYRIDVFSHFPSDVLAGAFTGIMVGKIALLKMPMRKNRE